MNIPFKEDKHYTEDDSILNEIESLTHLYLDDGEEVIDRPWYCMLNTITDNYMMSNQEVIDLAEKNGYIILRLPSVGDFVGGLAIAHKDVNKDAIKADIEKFIEHDEENRPEVEIKTITKINEEYERVSEEDCRELEKKIENLGFNVVSKRDSDGFSGKGKDTHYQIITKEGNQTEESFNEYIEKFDEILEDFEEETGSPCTFNMGLQDDGYISCGFDVRAIYYEPGNDVVHVRPQKLYYRNGKPANKGTEATLKQMSDVMGFDISDLVPVDKKKNEDLNNKTVDLNYDDLEVVFYNQRDVDKFKENKYVINYTYTVDYNTVFNLLEDYLEDDYSDIEELEKYVEDNFDSLVKYYEEDLKADLQDNAVNSAINTVDFDSYGESDSMLESKGDAYALYAFLHKKDGTKEVVNDGKAIEIDSQEAIAKKKREYEDSWNATNTNGTFKFIIRKIREGLKEEEVVENLTEDVSTIAGLKKLVDNIYNKLKGLKKPNVKTTGGEYYGSTELIRTHGNSLELLDEEDSYCVQVGGAYEYSDYRAEVTALYDAFPKVAWDIYDDITVEGIRCHLVHKYGSNFSIYGIEFRGTVKESLDSKLFDEEELKEKIKKIVDKYKENQDSKLGILEVESGNEAFIQHYDDKDIDFGPFSYHPEGEHANENGATPALITFTLTGGLNGWGELSNWGLYLENVSKLFKELEKETGLHIEIQNIENDIPDDVWTAQVLMYKEDTDLEESLNRLIESLSNHFNKDLGGDIEKHDELKTRLSSNYNVIDIIKEPKSIGDYYSGKEVKFRNHKWFAKLDDKSNLYYLIDAEKSPLYAGKLNAIILKDDNIDEDIEKHDTLNPVLFNENEELKPEIKEAIQKIVDEFVSDLKEDDIKFDLKDVLLIGSNVNYNYTKDSDLDIHLIADSSNLSCPDNLYPLLYSAYRSIFDKNYNITIKGIPAEIFVEMDEPHGSSNGVYSLYNGWIKTPEQKNIPELNRKAFDILFNEWEDKYTELLNKDNITSDDVKQFITDLYALRQEGILQSGEFDIKNLVFKEFRNLGYLDDLKAFKKELKGKELSLESLEEEVKLDSNTPYMLRDNGELLSCGTVHPYIKMYEEYDYEKNLKEFLSHSEFVTWIKENSHNEELLELLDNFMSLEDKNTEEAEKMFDKMNILLNQEFCRVRTSNIKYAYGGNNGEIYFRISSDDKNWFDAIWNTVMKNKDNIKYVTVVRDKPIIGNKQEYYIIDGKELRHLDVEDFLTLSGNPVLEDIDNSKQLNYNSNDNVTLDDDFNGNVYIDETLNEDAEKGDELTLENVKKWLKSEGATIRNKTRKAVVYKEGYEISLDGSEEKFEDIDLDSENDINKIYEAIIRKVEANEYPYTGIWMEGTTVYVDYSEHFLGTREEAIKKGYNQKQKTVFNWAYTSEDDKYIPTGYKKEENSSLTKDNSNSIIKEEVKDMHKLTLDNCKLESIFDMYVRYEDMTEEEVEEIYGTREELSDTINYYADLLLDGEKVAELNYANFEGNGDWAELDVHDITSDLLKDTLLKLGYQENVLDVNFTDHDLGRWDDDLKAEWNSTCEEVFKPFLEEVENAMNKEKEESLNEENQSELNKIAEELYNYLWKTEKVSYEIWGDEKDNSINADIEWGDWKHDHLWFDHVAERWLNEKGYEVVSFNTDVTEEDDSDTYSALHTLKIQKKQ